MYPLECEVKRQNEGEETEQMMGWKIKWAANGGLCLHVSKIQEDQAQISLCPHKLHSSSIFVDFINA